MKAFLPFDHADKKRRWPRYRHVDRVWTQALNQANVVVEWLLLLLLLSHGTLSCLNKRRGPKKWGHKLVATILPNFKRFNNFYRAMLCIRGTSHGPVSVSVRSSVTSRSSTKTAKQRITQTTPHNSPGTLVFWRQRSPRNSTGVTPY